MGYLATLSLSIIVFGILFLLKGKDNPKFRWIGIPLLLIGILFFLNIATKKTETNLIGMEILKDEPGEFLVELHYFPTKDEAFAFYEQKNVKEFVLFAKYEGSAEDLFKMINIKQTPDGGKKMAFFENPRRGESAQMVFNGFYRSNKLYTVHNSAQIKNK